MLWTCDVTLPYFDVHCRHPCTLTPSSALIGRVHSLEITTVDPVAGFRHSSVPPVTQTPLPRITPTHLSTLSTVSLYPTTQCASALPAPTTESPHGGDAVSLLGYPPPSLSRMIGRIELIPTGGHIETVCPRLCPRVGPLPLSLFCSPRWSDSD
jgi:hypothetical protein